MKSSYVIPEFFLWEAETMDAIDNELTIGEMADLYKVSLPTLRFYENKGLLKPIRIGTVRVYTARDCIRLQLILKGKKLGFSLLEIEKLISDRSNRKPETTLPVDKISQLNHERIAAQLSLLEQKRETTYTSISELRAALNLLGG